MSLFDQEWLGEMALSPDPGPPSPVRQDNRGGFDQNDQQSQGGKLAQYWAFRFTASKCDEKMIKEKLDVHWCKGFGFQKEKGKKRQQIEHYQGSFECQPRKRFKQLEAHFQETMPELKFSGQDYLEPTKSTAAQSYGMKEDTRVDGPWWSGWDYDKIAVETVYRVEIILQPWQKRILLILDGPQDDRSIWWFWEPYGGLGKTTFLKYICQNYKDVCISGGKAHDMKNGIVRFKEKKGHYPKIILINIPKTFDLNYFSAPGVEEVKDMFFFSGKYGSEGEDGQVCGRPPKVLVMANCTPPTEQMAKDRWKIRRLPDGKAKECAELDTDTWSD